jgi:hypothetical protein
MDIILLENIGFLKALFLMLFLHFVADWILQTDALAKFKQKKSWKEINSFTQDKYKNDYYMVLFTHSFMWSFFTFLPLWNNKLFYIIVVMNTIVHFIVDDEKANKCSISLVQDQLAHFAEILVSLIAAYLMM